jgi:hypothetical protein
MKKLIIFLAILSSLTLLVYHLPRLLDFRPVRAQVAARVSAATGWQVAANHLQWDWFPVPHFTLSTITMTRGGITIAIPETRIYPRLSSLLRHQFDLGELKLVKPKIAVSAWTLNESEPSPDLPNLNLSIVEGTALIAAPPFAKESGRSPLVINGINSRINLTTERCDLKISCASPLFTKLKLQGTYKTRERSYLFDYGISGLELGELVPDLISGRLRPKISGLSLQGNISGQGSENYRVQVEGDFPCFLLPRSPDKSFLDCGEFAFTVDKNPQALSIAIAKLELKNPAANISGRIAVSQDVTNSTATKGDAPPPAETWLVDLNGQNLDVSGIRQRILELFGDNHVAQLVCEIVRGGTANRASYYFKGHLADFESLEKMRIKVDVDRAEIHPPGTKLELTEAGGPIEIRDGYLSGSRLRARLGDSTGSNCTLFLDLLGRKNDFRLDLDIEADLSDLPRVLLDEVKHQRFQDEVRRFHHCQGRAQGHLNIGESLLNPEVTVLVNSMEARGEYDRVSWPFTINKGTLAVYPDKVAWRELKGTWGANRVYDSSGEVDWQGPVQLKLINLNATLALAPLIKELNADQVFPDALHKAITNAEGTLELNKAEFTGRLDTPESWRYSGYLATKGSRWISPLLPQPFLAESAEAFFSQEKIALRESRLQFDKQPLTIGGNFQHQRFESWRGQVTLSGTIRENLADWVKGKNWIPSQYFPRIPCTLERLRVDWDDKNTSVNGTIKAGSGDSEAPVVRLDLTDSPERFTIRELVLSAPQERGKLALNYPKSAPNRVSLNWQGFVDADSILKLLTSRIIPAQQLEGDFALQLPLRPEGKSLQGWLKTKGLEWPIGDAATPVTLNDLNLRGQDDGTLVIEKALISSRDSREIEVNGSINPSISQLDLKLNLTAELLARTTVEAITRGIGKLIETAEPNETGKKWPSRGTLQFKVDRFEPGQAALDSSNQGQPAASASNYVVAPARGFVTLLPSGGYSVDLRSSKICGVDISGTIYSAPEEGENTLNFFTDSATPPLLQEVIPCFGFNTTLIEGPLHLDGSLQGTTRNWRDGKITLYSEKGFIRRLGFLAKVFSVVNLTDLFTTQPLPQLGDDGFAYSSLEITSQIKDNQLLIEKAVVKGKGLNLFGQGKIDLQSGQADLIVMVAPLKSIDAIITNLPLIGTVAGGKDQALLSIPVGLKGDLRDPSVTLLPPEAIGEGIVNLLINTFKMPLAIFSPLRNIDR